MKNSFWNKFYECNCLAKAIVMSHDKNDDQYYFVIFRNCQFKIYEKTFLGKLRQIWQIIRHGTVWTDNIILDGYKAEELAKDILRLQKEKKIK